MYQGARIQLSRVCFTLTAIGLLALFSAGHAQAATLPSASTSVQCFADGNNAFHSTECTQGGFPGVPPSAFASATLSPFALVSVEVTAPPTTVLGAGADAVALYYFEVTGGNVGDIVPIKMDFSFGAFSTPESSALARLLVYTTAMGSVPPHAEELACNPQSCDGPEISDTLSFQVLSGSTLNSVTLYVMVQAPATRISSESARAFADPFIYVDPAFHNAGLYSIAVSPGVGNVPVPQVPEPATLLLVGSGLGAVSLLRRRRL